MTGQKFYDKRGNERSSEASAQAYNRQYAAEELATAEQVEASAKLAALGALRTAEEAEASRRAAERQAQYAKEGANEAALSRKAIEDKIRFDVDISFLSVSSHAEKVEYFMQDESRMGEVCEAVRRRVVMNGFDSIAAEHKRVLEDGKRAESERRELVTEVERLNKEIASLEALLRLNSADIVDEIRRRNRESKGAMTPAEFVRRELLIGALAVVLLVIGASGGRDTRAFLGLGILVALYAIFIVPHSHFSLEAKIKDDVESGRRRAASDLERFRVRLSQAGPLLTEAEARVSRAKARQSSLEAEAVAKIEEMEEDVADVAAEVLVDGVLAYLKRYPPNCRSAAEEISEAVRPIKYEFGTSMLGLLRNISYLLR